MSEKREDQNKPEEKGTGPTGNPQRIGELRLRDLVKFFPAAGDLTVKDLVDLLISIGRESSANQLQETGPPRQRDGSLGDWVNWHDKPITEIERRLK